MIVVEYFYQPQEKSSIIQDGTLVISGFGEIYINNPKNVGLFSDTYQDTESGFQITKPDSGWTIHNMSDELSEDEVLSLESKGFVDGIYVEKDHGKEFTITVFDIQQDNFDLHEFIDNQILQMESKKVKVLSEQVSPNNDWAIFAMDGSDVGMGYSEQMLFFKNDRLYMLQYSGDLPELQSPEQRDEIQNVLNSFEVI
ncbi:MAG: hypothetical protein ACRBB2_06805 [Nitrosopumilus sp.]